MNREKLSELFNVIKCKSNSLESYDTGNIPFVSSTVLNNGVEKMVDTPNQDQIIKTVPCIAVSGFGFATVQTRPFIGAGNNGAYVKALIPIKKMNMMELIWYSAQINMQSWRFSYGRLAIKQRVKILELIKFNLNDSKISKIEFELNKNLRDSYTRVVGNKQKS
jgi:hypothetical protein